MVNKKLDTILELAIEREEEAYDYYMDMAGRMTDAGLKDTLEYLAKEEAKHKKFLEQYRDGNQMGSIDIDTVVDYKIAEHLDVPVLSENAKPEDVYLLAAHKELQAYKFYLLLADMHNDGEAKQMLLKIANEEQKHKEKVEYLYSNAAFAQIAGG